MSIFSRLRKRGAEEGAQPAASAPNAPEQKAPPPAPMTPPAAPPTMPPSSTEQNRAAARVAPTPPRSNGVNGVNGANGVAHGAARAPITAKPAAPALPGVTPAHAPAAGPPAAPSLFPGAAPARAKTERASAAPPASALGAVPIAAVPVAVKEPAAGSLDLAIALALENDASKEAPVVSTASDRAALQATFEELAVPHVAPVRSAMMEVRWGEPQATWLEQAQPALKSLRKMAAEVGSTELVTALDDFLATLQKLLEPGQPPTLTGAGRDKLVAAYLPLCTCLPRAFELEGERERREPLIVRALLEQVEGLDPLMIDKMMAAGLGRLAALFAAKADEIAVVTAIPEAIAAAVAARVQAFRRSSPAALATIDPGATVRALAGQLDQMRTAHTGFERAAGGWSEADRQSKKQLRWQRQVSFLQVTIALAQLGEFELAARLPKMAFARRIEEVQRVLAKMATVHKVVWSFESGPHPVAA